MDNLDVIDQIEVETVSYMVLLQLEYIFFRSLSLIHI